MTGNVEKAATKMAKSIDAALRDHYAALAEILREFRDTLPPGIPDDMVVVAIDAIVREAFMKVEYNFTFTKHLIWRSKG